MQHREHLRTAVPVHGCRRIKRRSSCEQERDVYGHRASWSVWRHSNSGRSSSDRVWGRCRVPAPTDATGLVDGAYQPWSVCSGCCADVRGEHDSMLKTNDLRIRIFDCLGCLSCVFIDCSPYFWWDRDSYAPNLFYLPFFDIREFHDPTSKVITQ